MADGGDVGCVSRGGTPFATNVVGDPPGIDRRTTYCRLVSQYCQERMVCDRSSPDDGPRPTVGKTDAFQEDGEGAGLGEGITGQTHLSNLSRARAGAAAHDGAIGQSTRWMLAICLEPSAAHELASWRASRYAIWLGVWTRPSDRNMPKGRESGSGRESQTRGDEAYAQGFPREYCWSDCDGGSGSRAWRSAPSARTRRTRELAAPSARRSSRRHCGQQRSWLGMLRAAI